MRKSIFYHAGCPVCVSAEQEIVSLIGEENVEIVHLGERNEQLEAASNFGVRSVPALVTPTGGVLHLNYGASFEELRS